MIYCSLGEFCHASALIKANGLKLASYPFDWIFSNDQMIKHCIEDDFRTFLNKSEYTTNLIDASICEHNFYSTMIENYQGIGKEKVLFNHHNPLTNEDHYAYFERCVNRFRELLTSSEEKTFVMFHRGSFDIRAEVKKASLLCGFLDGHTTNYTLLVINQRTTGTQTRQLIVQGNLKFLNLTTISGSGGTCFVNELDDSYLNKLFNEIR